MTLRTLRGPHAGALLLLALVVAFLMPWVYIPAAHAAGSSLRVTVFDDRVVDGVFSGNTSNKSGSRDGKRSDGFAYLHDASGAWIAGSSDASGDYYFPNVAAGAGTLYFAVDGPEVKSVVRDAATGAVLNQRTDVSFSGGTYIDPAGHQSPHSLDAGPRMAEASVSIGAGETKGEFAITAIQAVATVGLEGNSLKPVSGHADISFLSNGATIPAKDDGSAKYRTNADVFFPATTMGITVKPVKGFHLVNVTAETTNGEINLKREGNTFTLQMEDLPFSVGFVEFRAVVREEASASPTAASHAPVAVSESAAPTESTVPAPAPAPGAEVPAWLWPSVIGAVAVLLIAALFWLWLRNRTQQREEAARHAALPDITAFATPEQREVLQRKRAADGISSEDAVLPQGAAPAAPERPGPELSVASASSAPGPREHRPRAPWKQSSSSSSQPSPPSKASPDGAHDSAPATGTLPVVRRSEQD